MEVVRAARVESRPEVPYLGTRCLTPFRGMLRVRDELLAELGSWVAQSGVVVVGYGFLRLHTVDMSGSMEIEVGLVTPEARRGADLVRSGSLPAGRCATLTYVDHAMRANRALMEWARANAVTFDRWDVPEGDRFACRYEAYLTNRKIEPKKTKWHVELHQGRGLTATRRADLSGFSRTLAQANVRFGFGRVAPERSRSLRLLSRKPRATLD